MKTEKEGRSIWKIRSVGNKSVRKHNVITEGKARTVRERGKKGRKTTLHFFLAEEEHENRLGP